MKEEPNIEELLNSFIDGELTDRQEIEVRRLISHDAQAAKRLRELQKCKMLVSSLPPAEAPGEMLEQIKASLEERTLMGQRQSRFEERQGARHLLARKVLTAAAMIGLAAFLGAVIYTIMVPKSIPPATAFSGRLELKTTELMVVDAAINNAIDDNGISRHSGSGKQGSKNVYALSGSREAMSSLLADLKNMWGSFDSATLFVETKTSGEQVVNDVSADAISDLITPFKPDLTGPEGTIKAPVTQAKADERVRLTIVLTGGE